MRIRVVHMVAMVMMLLLLLLPSFSTAFYERGSHVIMLDSHSKLKALRSSNYLWLVEIYKQGCGFCQKLAPNYDVVATKLRRLVRVAAVDIEKSNEIAKALEETYGFKVSGVPTLFYLKPQAKGNKRLIMYEGDRSAKSLYQEALNYMPDSSKYVTDAAFDKFRTQDMPTALLVTEKSTTPALWKALSSKYLNRMVLGLTNPKQKAIMQYLNATDAPAVYIIPKAEGEKPTRYEGDVSFIGLDFFLMDYALPKSSKDKASKRSSQQGKQSSSEQQPKKEAANDKAHGKVKRATDLSKITRAQLNAMKIPQLRAIMQEYGAPCRGCVEKAHYVDRIEKLAALGIQPGQRYVPAPDTSTTDNNSCQAQVLELKDKVNELEQELAILRVQLESASNRMQYDGVPPPQAEPMQPHAGSHVVINRVDDDYVEEVVYEDDAEAPVDPATQATFDYQGTETPDSHDEL